MITRRRLIPLALCIAIAVAITPLPRAVHAEEGAEIEAFNAEKFWTYAGCAASIALATGTGGGWILVAITCSKAATAYWTT